MSHGWCYGWRPTIAAWSRHASSSWTEGGTSLLLSSRVALNKDVLDGQVLWCRFSASVPGPSVGGFFKTWDSTDVAEATRLVDICLDAGLNIFDSADIYSAGAAEEILGTAIKGRRDKLIISTKATFRAGESANDVGSPPLTSSALAMAHCSGSAPITSISASSMAMTL
jgi:hypothetical protein